MELLFTVPLDEELPEEEDEPEPDGTVPDPFMVVLTGTRKLLPLIMLFRLDLLFMALRRASFAP